MEPKEQQEPRLTKMEKKVYQLCGDGHSNLDIGTALNISVNTVKTHLRSVFKKLQVSNRRELMLIHLTTQRKLV